MRNNVYFILGKPCYVYVSVIGYTGRAGRRNTEYASRLHRTAQCLLPNRYFNDSNLSPVFTDSITIFHNKCIKNNFRQGENNSANTENAIELAKNIR